MLSAPDKRKLTSMFGSGIEVKDVSGDLETGHVTLLPSGSALSKGHLAGKGGGRSVGERVHLLPSSGKLTPTAGGVVPDGSQGSPSGPRTPTAAATAGWLRSPPASPGDSPPEEDKKRSPKA